jgi:hypothetical protein
LLPVNLGEHKMSFEQMCIWGAVALAILLDIWLMRRARRYFLQRGIGIGTNPQEVRVLGIFSPVLTWFKQRCLPAIQRRALEWAWPRLQRGMLAEVSLIALWAMWVGRAYLDFDPYTWPMGLEMGAQLQTHHFWTQWQSCGLCALWNGSLNGGYPALADIFGSTLHPLVMVTTLIWGVMGGAKVALVVALWMAGLAQWWIAKSLGLGRVARIWSALLAVVGGHLSGRMENSNFGLVLSTAACSLALAAALDLGVTGRRRAALLLALTGAMAVVSGQGYLQLALLSWAPACAFFLLDRNLKLRPVWREYATAVGLGLLLAGVFLVPMWHFQPQIYKDTDLLFPAAQPLEYIPLNLVIQDTNFMRAQVLGKMPFPYMYNLYVGWTPVLLAVLCLRFARRQDRRALLCLITGVLLMFLMASAIPLRWLVKLVPEISGFRHSALIAGLAVPAILGLAAYGLDRLLAQDWPQIILRIYPSGQDTKPLSMTWIAVIVLVWSLYPPYELAQTWLATRENSDIYTLVPALQTPGLQWVAAPFGEHFWIEPALQIDLKLTNVVWAWKWKNHELPQPRLIANRPGPPPGGVPAGKLGDIPVFEIPQNEYAYVDLNGRTVSCQATGSGGDLTVHCSTDQPGRLYVQENFWSGWFAWMDGVSVPLLRGQWLSVEAQPGSHTYRFRYLPLDVLLGALASMAGVIVWLWLWWRSDDPHVRNVTEAQ